jgi:hypothetical protein
VSAKAPERLWVLEKGDNLLKFEFGFVNPGDVLESHLCIRFDIDFGVRFSHGHEAAKALATRKPAD